MRGPGLCLPSVQHEKRNPHQTAWQGSSASLEAVGGEPHRRRALGQYARVGLRSSYPVTAPSDALDTSRAYFAMTPRA